MSETDKLFDDIPSEDDDLFDSAEDSVEDDEVESSEADNWEVNEETPTVAPDLLQEEKPEGPKYRRPRANIYTMLLVLSLIFTGITIAICYFECTPYEYGDPPYKEGSTIKVMPVAPGP